MPGLSVTDANHQAWEKGRRQCVAGVQPGAAARRAPSAVRRLQRGPHRECAALTEIRRVRSPPDALYFDAGSQMSVAAADASEEFIKKPAHPPRPM